MLLKIYSFFMLLLFVTLAGCKKLVEVKNPDTTISEDNVYSTDATAIAAVTGIYTQMSLGPMFERGITSLSLLPGLSADELTLYPGVKNVTYTAYYTNALSSLSLGNSDPWSTFYPLIFSANAAIEGIDKSTTLTPAVKKQLNGEAKFLRAFFYFYLVSLYGDVPLITGTDFSFNSTVARSPKSNVWQQVVADLKDAEVLLSTDYLDASLLSATPEKVRPTKWVCKALLARAYLYLNDWANAEAKSSAVIDSSSIFSLSALHDVFLKNSPEAVWQLQPVQANFNTWDAWLFTIPDSGPNDDHPVYLSDFLLKSFEDSDQRRKEWVDSVVAGGQTYHFAYKYKISALGEPVDEYEMVFRLAEQYLIRAESRAELNDLSGAEADVNVIRGRAGLGAINGMSKDNLLAGILHERQIELFTEWGHRWLDLKRTGKADEVMSMATPQKGGTWNSYQQWYPIPFAEIRKDPKLVQNPGY